MDLKNLVRTLSSQFWTPFWTPVLDPSSRPQFLGFWAYQEQEHTLVKSASCCWIAHFGCSYFCCCFFVGNWFESLELQQGHKCFKQESEQQQQQDEEEVVMASLSTALQLGFIPPPPVAAANSKKNLLLLLDKQLPQQVSSSSHQFVDKKSPSSSTVSKLVLWSLGSWMAPPPHHWVNP